MKKINLVFLFFVLLLSGQIKLKAQDFECFVLAPPEKVLQGVKKIAVLNFENFDKSDYYKAFGGSAFVDYLTSKLLDETRGIYNLKGGMFSKDKEGKTFIKSPTINIYQIVEREQLNKVMGEKQLGSNIALNDNQAADIGKVLGIDALVLGTIKHNMKSNRTYTDYKDGSRVYSTENTCETEINLKIVSVSNAQIITTKTFKRVSSDKKSGNEESNVLSESQLAETNMKMLAFDAATYIEPYYIYDKVEFQKIKVAEFKEKAKQVNSYFENGDLKSAFALYKAIYDADNYNAYAAYNIGQLYFITGDYEECGKWFQIASDIDNKTFGKYNEQAKAWVAYAPVLKQVGINIEKYDFSLSANNDVLADKVRTRGKKADRYEVYSESKTTSNIVTKVPGDTEFVIIKIEGDFYLIKLLGGKQGYINKGSLDI